MLEYEDAEAVLAVYSIEELLNDNGLTVADALCILVNENFIDLSVPCPVH